MATTKAPEIQITKDYSKFKLMSGNRSVDYNHVKRLKREMEKNPHLFATNPIQVNENMYIIDGQHRRQAAQELDREIFYVVLPGITLNDTRSLNVTQKHWDLMDFAKSYAEGGHKDYQTFITMVGKYPHLAASIIMKILAGQQLHRIGEDFRRGEFKIDDIETATKYLDRMEEIIGKTKIHMNMPMAMSLLKMFSGENGGDEDFDYTKFINKLDRKGAIEIFTVYPIVRGCLRSIEDVYNFQSNTRIRLY